MKQQLDRYFELLPVLLIIAILIAGEIRSQWSAGPSKVSYPKLDVEAPRLILR